MEITHLSLLIILCVGVHGSSSEILQRPKRWIIDSFSIDEGYDGGYPYLLGEIKLADAIYLLKIHGQGVDEEPYDVIRIEEDTGKLWVIRPVDYEQHQRLDLTFQAFDKNTNEINTRLGTIVYIRDVNDCAPTFDHEMYETTIKESTSQGTDLITVRATDKDLTGTFRQFKLRIVSVSPQQRDVEFYLKTISGGVGTISFKGCLDHEQAPRYTIIVEAKEYGQTKLLSSSCTIVLNIEDQNNHAPVITQQKAVARVREDQENVLLLRVPVTDDDTKNTPSWRAVFHVREDTDNNFRITTDHKTNEGLLYLNKSLDYEKTPVKNITVWVENEIPYHFCKVLKRNTVGPWKVTFSIVTSDDVGGTLPALAQAIQQVTVIVEDVNEAPVFDIADQSVMMTENIDVGTHLKTFSAKDPDVRHANRVVYKKGKDPAGWVTVDPKTGSIETTKILDRESPFVNNSVYVVTIEATDDRKPSKTSTATLSILIGDLNDNTPFLVSNTIDMCQSDDRSLAPIEASDLDQEPNAGPFSFKLLGDVKGKWRVEPSYGVSVNLVKESAVYSGRHDLMVEVADLQGYTVVHNLSVTVCSCSDQTKPNCRLRKSATTAAGGGIAIILLSLLLFAGEPDKIPVGDDEGCGNLIISNTENIGNDCEVTFSSDPKLNQIQTTSNTQVVSAAPKLSPLLQRKYLQEKLKAKPWLYNIAFSETSIGDSTDSIQSQRQKYTFVRGSMRTSVGASSVGGARHQRRASNYTNHLQIQRIISKEMQKVETRSNKVDDYQPHVYAEEGDSKHDFELDDLSISEINFDPDSELDSKFQKLASICMPIDNPQA